MSAADIHCDYSLRGSWPLAFHKWDSVDALKAHAAAPHMAAYGDHGEEGVRAAAGLDRQRILGIDRGAVFHAALLGAHGRNVGAEDLQDRLALAGLGGNDGDDMDHCCSSFSAEIVAYKASHLRARRFRVSVAA